MLELLGLARRELCLYARSRSAAVRHRRGAGGGAARGLAGRGASVRILVSSPPCRCRTVTACSIWRAPAACSPSARRTQRICNTLGLPLNDRRGYYFPHAQRRFEGEAHTYAPGRHAQLQEYFNQVWQRASPSQELRQLSL